MSPQSPSKLTTAQSIPGWKIRQTLGPVTASVVAGAKIFSDFAASLTDFFGGRSESVKRQLEAIKDEALAELYCSACKRGANWFIGLHIDFDEISGKK